MKVIVFLNQLGLGGTEKAACRWARGLKMRGHQVAALALSDGPRRGELEEFDIPVLISRPNADEVADRLRETAPDILHAHAPGHPHEGDVLGAALRLLRKRIPVVQTNIFGHLWNPPENEWTDFRLFISWTNCVQAARRVFCPLDESFFRHASVAVYPLDPLEPPPPADIAAFRQRLGVADDEILFGRFSRPELNKWTDLALKAFQLAARRNSRIRLLLREPPAVIAERLRHSSDAQRYVILAATSDAEELRLTMSALDVVLHTSLVGESFGYGIAEPMNLGKPVITHSVPWHDQAQIELVRPGEAGLVASTPATMAEAILRLAGDVSLRQSMGRAAQQHIRALANPELSVTRLERVCETVLAGRENPFAAEDLARAREAAAYLDRNQFGSTWRERIFLRLRYARARFHQWRLYRGTN